MLCCNNCIINPICQIGCGELLGDLNKITLKDFTKYVKLPKRLISIRQLMGQKNLILNFDHDIKFEVNEYLTCLFYKNGKLNREGGPAAEYVNGNKYWYKNGKFHREDRPAIEYISGGKCWYKNGELHRESGPAVEYVNGGKCWYKNGKFYREDGPAIECANGDKYWYINEKLVKKRKRK